MLFVDGILNREIECSFFECLNNRLTIYLSEKDLYVIELSVHYLLLSQADCSLKQKLLNLVEDHHTVLKKWFKRLIEAK